MTLNVLYGSINNKIIHKHLLKGLKLNYLICFESLVQTFISSQINLWSVSITVPQFLASTQQLQNYRNVENEAENLFSMLWSSK